MPRKLNAERRHRIPKMGFRVTNWAEYEAGLRRRGSLTMWVTQEAMDAWDAAPRSTRGGQSIYSDSAIQTCLMLRAGFKLPLRQAEGLMTSIVELLGCDLAVPDHTTVSRRAMKLPSIARAALPKGPLHVVIDSTGLKVYGAGEWLADKEGQRARREWGKLHLAVDADSGQIVAVRLTNQDVDDSSKVEPLLEQIPVEIEQVTADGAYDGEPTYATIAARGAEIEVTIPPRARSTQCPNRGWMRHAATSTSTPSRRWAGLAGNVCRAMAGGHLTRRRWAATKGSLARDCVRATTRADVSKRQWVRSY